MSQEIAQLDKEIATALRGAVIGTKRSPALKAYSSQNRKLLDKHNAKGNRRESRRDTAKRAVGKVVDTLPLTRRTARAMSLGRLADQVKTQAEIRYQANFVEDTKTAEKAGKKIEIIRDEFGRRGATQSAAATNDVLATTSARFVATEREHRNDRDYFKEDDYGLARTDQARQVLGVGATVAAAATTAVAAEAVSEAISEQQEVAQEEVAQQAPEQQSEAEAVVADPTEAEAAQQAPEQEGPNVADMWENLDNIELAHSLDPDFFGPDMARAINDRAEELGYPSVPEGEQTTQEVVADSAESEAAAEAARFSEEVTSARDMSEAVATSQAENQSESSSTKESESVKESVSEAAEM